MLHFVLLNLKMVFSFVVGFHTSSWTTGSEWKLYTIHTTQNALYRNNIDSVSQTVASHWSLSVLPEKNKNYLNSLNAFDLKNWLQHLNFSSIICHRHVFLHYIHRNSYVLSSSSKILPNTKFKFLIAHSSRKGRDFTLFWVRGPGEGGSIKVVCFEEETTETKVTNPKSVLVSSPG